MTEAEIERVCVEAVFRLGGGELMDVPWTASYGSEVLGTFPHWYEGIPEWCDVEDDDLHDEGATYRTLIPAPNPYSGPPSELRDENGTWKLLRTFTSSGETECVYRGSDEGEIVLATQAQDGESCPCCGESVGSKHGYIYLGEGSCEAVYKLEGSESDG